MVLSAFRKKKTRSPANPLDIGSRTQLLNYLCAQYGYQRYLEIGVRNPNDNFRYIETPHKDGVDPVARCNFRMPSDDFFHLLDETPGRQPYDLVFIDGLHIADQVERDVMNSLRHLSDGGSIVLHDCNPITENAQIDEYIPGAVWNGTVWKAWALLRATRPDLFMCVIDIDEGCGVIRKGRQTCYSPWPPPSGQSPSYEFLAANRVSLLNLTSVAEFLRLMDQQFGASIR